MKRLFLRGIDVPTGTPDGQFPQTAGGKLILGDPPAGSGGGVQSIVPGTGIAVDNTDPQNPVISATGGGGGGGGTPTGTGREDTFSTSLTVASGLYNPVFNWIEILATFWLASVKVYSEGGGASEVVVRTGGGAVLSQGAFTSPASAAWVTVSLDAPVLLTQRDYICIGMEFGNTVHPWRRTSYLYAGTLWRMNNDRVNDFFTGSDYSETPGMGLIEYNG